MYGGHSTFLPLKVNQAGVIPIIFASSVLMFPVTIAQFIDNEFVHKVADLFTWGTPLQTALYAILIFIFTYFYTAISINITDMADNMKKYGGFIPGIRAGKMCIRDRVSKVQLSQLNLKKNAYLLKALTL